jgi:hypothetical protein
MRLLIRFLIGAAAVLALTIAVVFLARKPLVENAVAHALEGAGFNNPSAKLDTLTLSEARFAAIKAGGADELNLSDVAASFGLRELLFDGRLRRIDLKGGSISASIGDDGRINIAGWSPDPNAKPAPPPFDEMGVDRLKLVAVTPKGPAALSVSGLFAYRDGGTFDLTLDAESAGWAALRLQNASGKAKATFGADGEVTIQGGAKTDFVAPTGAVRLVDLGVDAKLRSWRRFFDPAEREAAGSAALDLRSSTIDLAKTPALSGLAAPADRVFGEVWAVGRIVAEMTSDGVRIAIGAPITLLAESGDRLIIDSDDAVIYVKDPAGATFGLRVRMEGPSAAGEASLGARSEGDGPWRISGKVQLGEQKIAGLSIGGMDAQFNGALDDDRLAGALNLDGRIAAAAVGRLRIADIPATTRLAIDADLKAKTLTATPDGSTCISVDRASLSIPDQDLTTRFRTANLCARDGPLFAIGFGEAPSTRVNGALSAASIDLRLGKTVLAGAPPMVAFALDYDPKAQTSAAHGRITGGASVLNNAFKLTGADGTFEAGLKGEALSAQATLARLVISQAAELEIVAPVVVKGDASLAENLASFDFAVATPQGRPLGAGKGVHAVKTGKGSATFDSGLLVFAPGGLQPDRVIPAFRGVVGAASGTTSGKATFAWSPGGVTSSGAFALDNVSFQGPGVAVTRTEGVSGDLKLTSLLPVATDGEQTISIRKIDLDALKLENGVINFRMRGDDTLEIINAEFPWFGGVIGAYQTEMKLVGGEAKTKLQIDNVNLRDLLASFNIEGLSGEGVIEGVLPLSFEGGRARINNGILSAKGKGVVRYVGKATGAASEANAQTSLAFEALRELRFENLSATIDGPLDGRLDFKILFEGRSDIPIKTRGGIQRVDSPIIYRVKIDAPLLSLLDQAVVSTDIRRQIDRAVKESGDKPTDRP